jgi:CRP-like cAMP-binding protein
LSSNRILSRLSREELALLEPHLEAVDLPARKSLEKRKKRIEDVYFIESGFASVVANGTSKPSIEVGIIGREGMTGLAVVLGHDRAQHDTFIQLPGKGLRMTVDSFREAQDRSVRCTASCCAMPTRFLCRRRRPRWPTGAARSRND